jgi:hypothetical protein
VATMDLVFPALWPEGHIARFLMLSPEKPRGEVTKISPIAPPSAHIGIMVG